MAVLILAHARSAWKCILAASRPAAAPLVLWGGDRRSFLVEASEGDDELRREVELLLDL
jgi:hypothetical protein